MQIFMNVLWITFVANYELQFTSDINTSDDLNIEKENNLLKWNYRIYLKTNIGTQANPTDYQITHVGRV